MSIDMMCAQERIVVENEEWIVVVPYWWVSRYISCPDVLNVLTGQLGRTRHCSFPRDMCYD